MEKHISYRRVSTDEQGISNLGLEAQLEQITRAFGTPEMDFVDIESGSVDNRVNLLKAIEKCAELGCFLSIARQDRISRDTHFVSGLMKKGLDFRAADNPNATTFMKHLYAALSEDERKAISIRTKAALAIKKKQLEAIGCRLGCPAITKNGRTIQEVLAENRSKRIYPKPDLSKVKTLKMLKDKGSSIEEVQEVARQLFGKYISKVTIYKYLKMEVA
jgi:DNA invertase Pin-like site-specific DNA recombinase